MAGFRLPAKTFDAAVLLGGSLQVRFGAVIGGHILLARRWQNKFRLRQKTKSDASRSAKFTPVSVIVPVPAVIKTSAPAAVM